jgi:hypothetical protein
VLSILIRGVGPARRQERVSIPPERASESNLLDRICPKRVEHDRNISSVPVFENLAARGASSAMPLRDKAYFRLDEIQAQLGLSRGDLAYLVETGQLKTSARVWDVLIEEGVYEQEADGRPFHLPYDRRRFSGLLDLRAKDVYRLLRDQIAVVDAFEAREGEYLDLLQPDDGVEVRLDDLVIRREERDRFEREQGPISPRLNGRAFLVLGDYKEVMIGGRAFHLGPCQAEVVRLLHEAALAGEPWRYGKSALAAAGSSCTRMADLFKSQQHWRELIASDGRGHYRLAIPLPTSR